MPQCKIGESMPPRENLRIFKKIQKKLEIVPISQCDSQKCSGVDRNYFHGVWYMEGTIEVGIICGQQTRLEKIPPKTLGIYRNWVKIEFIFTLHVQKFEIFSLDLMPPCLQFYTCSTAVITFRPSDDLQTGAPWYVVRNCLLKFCFSHFLMHLFYFLACTTFFCIAYACIFDTSVFRTMHM